MLVAGSSGGQLLRIFETWCLSRLGQKEWDRRVEYKTAKALLRMWQHVKESGHLACAKSNLVSCAYYIGKQRPQGTQQTGKTTPSLNDWTYT